MVTKNKAATRYFQKFHTEKFQIRNMGGLLDLDLRGGGGRSGSRWQRKPHKNEKRYNITARFSPNLSLFCIFVAIFFPSNNVPLS